MPNRKAFALAGLAWTLTCSALAAGKPAGVIAGAEPAYVAAVEVAQDSAAPPGYGEALRAAVLKEAALYGSSGLPLTVRIDLNRVHLKNSLQNILIGDDDMTRGWVQVLDPAAGQRLGLFQVAVDAEHGVNGAGLAVGVAGMLDPTGIVSVGATVASVAATEGGRSRAEARMIDNFAVQTLRETFGDARARAVHGLKPR